MRPKPHGHNRRGLASQVQVNIPFPYLAAGYLERFLEPGLNPEIGLYAYSLGHYSAGGLSPMRPAPFRGPGGGSPCTPPFKTSCRGRWTTASWPPRGGACARPSAICRSFARLTVVCHLGYEARFYGGDTPKWLARSAATWKELAARAAPHGVTVMLENVYETEPELLLEVLGPGGRRPISRSAWTWAISVPSAAAICPAGSKPWPRSSASSISTTTTADHDSHLALGAGRVHSRGAESLDSLPATGSRPLITLEPHQEGSLQPLPGILGRHLALGLIQVAVKRH